VKGQKRATPRTAPSRESRASAASAEKATARDAAPSRSTGPRGQADQLKAILSKGLDLAEASLSLGLTVINRVGAAAQEQVLSITRSSRATRASAPGVERGDEVEPGTPVPPRTPDAAVPEEPQYCITNRLPLAPGSPVKVSFSINNDSLATPKKVSLRIEGFVGETEGARIARDGFTVTPSRRTIAPMDFEKFVLQGALPPDAPPDIYQGWVVVSSGDDFRIPIRLVAVTP
jgi:hypothetical protein